MTRLAPINARWRFSLRALVILVLAAPPVLGLAWWVLPTMWEELDFLLTHPGWGK